ncbi:unnamed protein product [Effrenium voratum]|nr:unnamed protein product [Effrenium voratum]
MRKPLPDYYAALEIHEDSDELTIKKAYRRLVLQWHPDRNPSDREAAEEKIRLLNIAYETVTNPLKRETYDLQRAASKKRKGPLKPRSAPRVGVPKEFMMQPVGHPESFVRSLGRRVVVHSRGDAPDANFQSFFLGSKFALWWLPEVNNMCRIRSLGSKARGDKRAAAAGRAGGLNMAFDPHKAKTAGAAGGEVRMVPANKGQKADSVNFVTKASPICEGALRFESASQRGQYLAFIPPSHLRVVPFLEETEDRVLDFLFVDFASMFKFITLQEVLEPIFSSEAPGTWIELSKLQDDEAVKSHFKEVMGKEVWDAEDFQAYFEGHWATFEYKPQDEKVARLRQRELSKSCSEVLHLAVLLNSPDSRQPLLDCLQQGLIGSLQALSGVYEGDLVQRSAFFQRTTAFWSLTYGLLVVILGALLSEYRRSTKHEAPTSVAAGWCLLCLLGAAMMPCSVAWMGLIIGLWMLHLSLLHEPAGVDDRGHWPGLTLLASPSPHSQAPGRSMVMSMRTILCIVTLTAAYTFLVPGIVTKMFSAKAVVGASEILDIEKSTLGLVQMLVEQGQWLPAAIIFTYSVLMPFAKLGVLLLYVRPAWDGSRFLLSDSAVRVVQRISKWATVDVFTCATICGLFCQPHMYLEIQLLDGFYYFLTYCVLSVTGALLIHLPNKAKEPDSDDEVECSAKAGAASVVAISATLALLFLPILKVHFATISLDASVSIWTLIWSLFARFPGAAIVLALLLVAFPVADATLVALEWSRSRGSGASAQPPCGFGDGTREDSAVGKRSCFRDFAMLDVYALSCVVVLTAVTSLHNDLHLHLLPAGWVLCSWAVPWVAYSWTAERPRHERLAKRLRATPKAEEVVAAVSQSAEGDLQNLPIGALARALTALAKASEDAAHAQTADESTAAQIRLLAALRAVKLKGEESTDIPAFELLHSAEKVQELGGDNPDDTVLVQRTAAARILASKAAHAANKEGGMIEAGFTLPDVLRFLLLPGTAGRDMLLATACVPLFEGRRLPEQREVLRTAKERNSTNLAAAAGTAVLKTLSRGGGPTDHVAATDDHVETVKEVAQCGVRLPAAAALLRRMAATAKPLKLAEALMSLAQRCGPGQAEDLQAIAETLASKGFGDFSPELLLEIVLASSKNEVLEALVLPAASAAANILSKWSFEDMVKLLLALARRKSLFSPEVAAALRGAAEKCLTAEQLQLLCPHDLAGMALAVLGHGWVELQEEATSQELLRRLPHFPAKDLLTVTPVLLQAQPSKLIGAWPKVLSASEQPAKDAKAAAKAKSEALSADQLVQLARLTSQVPETTAKRDAFLEDLAERLLPKVHELSASGRAQLSAELKGQGLGATAKKVALQKSLSAGVIQQPPTSQSEGQPASQKRALTPTGPTGQLSKKQRGTQFRNKKRTR